MWPWHVFPVSLGWDSSHCPHQSFYRMKKKRKVLPTGQSPLTVAFVKLQPELCEALAKVVGYNPSFLCAKSLRVPSFRSFPSSRPQAHLHLELTWDKAPGPYQTGFCSPWLGLGLWGWEMQLIPREVALIARRYYCGQYQRGWQTYWFQSRRWTQVTSPLHGLGFDLRSAGQEQLRLTYAVACGVHLRPLAPQLSLSPRLDLMTPECTADWDVNAIWGLSARRVSTKDKILLYMRIWRCTIWCNFCANFEKTFKKQHKK